MPRRDAACAGCIWDNLKKVYRILNFQGDFAPLFRCVFHRYNKAELHSWRARAAEPGAPKVEVFNACHLRPQSHGALEREEGLLEGSISESFSHPHSPVRHGSERTSCVAPDNDDRITLYSVGILRFFFFVSPLNGI